MKNKKHAFQWKWILPFEILFGVALLAVVFVVASDADISSAEAQLTTTVEYMKKQCNESQMRDLASEAKSLLRVTQSAEQVKLRLEYEGGADEAQLQTLVADTYLDGIVLLDESGNIAACVDKTGIEAEALLVRVDEAALMDCMVFGEKTYAVRLTNDDESYIDLAAVGRADEPGIIIGYYCTSTEYAQKFNNSILSLVSGYSLAHDGTVVISSGNRIVASNNEALVGTNTEDVTILHYIMERGARKKLVHTKEKRFAAARSFGLMDKSQNYYIYAYMTERNVFATTPSSMLYVLAIYMLLLAVRHMLLWRTEQSYERRQLVIQKEYAEKLEAKNRELKKTAQQAEKANAAKSNFLSRMSHDIRTPLNGIVGLLKIDEAHFDDKELIRANHEKMLVSADHLLSLINDVLQMSKLEDGNTVLTHEYISLADLTRDIVTIIVGRAVEAGLEWDSEKGKSVIPYPYVYGSPVHLRQIFLNIYGNCIKYNRPGGKITTIVDSLGDHDGICTYRWTITDTGIGMSAEFLEHIFDPFAQERNDARSVYQGTGLGMAIVKNLLDQMGGSITVTSQVGVGSKFVITIPLEIAPPPDETRKQAPAERGSIRGLRLLLAEDNDLNAEIAQVLLHDEGAEVTTVHDGKQAVSAFAMSEPGTFDAILMDIMMPVMDGLTATKTIRAMDRPDAKTIPIIAMTANAFEEDAKACLAAGMNAHLSKPLQISQVVSAIAQLCRKTGKEETK